jgi:hypothetical protein
MAQITTKYIIFAPVTSSGVHKVYHIHTDYIAWLKRFPVRNKCHVDIHTYIINIIYIYIHKYINNLQP